MLRWIWSDVSRKERQDKDVKKGQMLSIKKNRSGSRDNDLEPSLDVRAGLHLPAFGTHISQYE